MSRLLSNLIDTPGHLLRATLPSLLDDAEDAAAFAPSTSSSLVANLTTTTTTTT